MKKTAECGAEVNYGGDKLHMLLYVDDIVLIAPSIEKAQQKLNVLSQWCQTWQMRINTESCG